MIKVNKVLILNLYKLSELDDTQTHFYSEIKPSEDAIRQVSMSERRQKQKVTSDYPNLD